jgi:outer membrane protein OmpU
MSREFLGTENESYNPRERIMKKVLLTTTALVMTAGVAAAEVSLSGTAGVSSTKVGAAAARMTSGVDLNMAVSATAGNGVTMSATVDLGEGELIDYNDDFAVDAQYDATAGAGAVGSSAAPAITLGYNGTTVVVDAGGVDDLYDDAQHDDVSVAMTVGGFATTVTMDTDASTGHGSYSVGYTVGDLTATLTGSTDPDTTTAAGVTTDNSGSKIALAYAMGDLSLNASTDDGGDDKSTHTAGFSYVMDAITVSYTMKNASEEGWKDYDTKISYSAGAISASYATDEEGVSKVIAEYDMGGGATLFASSKTTKGTNNFQTLGMNFKF